MSTSEKIVRPRGLGHSYEEIQRDLLARIEKGAWDAGAKIPVRHELAKEYGVAVATLERAVSGLVLKGVLTTNRTGTFVSSPRSEKAGDMMARRAPVSTLDHDMPLVSDLLENSRPMPFDSLAGKVDLSTDPMPFSIGRAAKKPYTWIISNLSEKLSERLPGNWVHRAATSFERAIQQAGGRTRLIDLGVGHTLHPFENLRDAIEHGINSIALLGGIENNPEHLTLIEQLMDARLAGEPEIPVVEIAMAHAPQWSFDSVGYDGSLGVYKAVKHLLSLGHRKIAFLGDAEVEWVRRRLYAFRAALASVGFDERYVVPASFTESDVVSGRVRWHEVGRLLARKYLDTPDALEATAAFIINDNVAISFAADLRAAGRPVPESLSLIGFDDVQEGASHGLTTVHPPMEAMGAQAADIVMQRLNQPESDKRFSIVMNSSLVVRSSTRQL